MLITISEDLISDSKSTESHELEAVVRVVSLADVKLQLLKNVLHLVMFFTYTLQLC